MRSLIPFLKKEVLLISRAPQSLVGIFFFSFLILVLFEILLPTGMGLDKKLAPMILWLILLFGGMLRMSRTHDDEARAGLMEIYRLSSGIATPYFLSKFLVNYAFLLLLAFFSLGGMVIFFNLEGIGGILGWLSLPFALGLFGFALIGTVFSGLIVSETKKELLLPILGYPILVPLILGVMESLKGQLGEALGWELSWIKLLCVFDVIYFVLSLMVFDFLLENE